MMASLGESAGTRAAISAGVRQAWDEGTAVIGPAAGFPNWWQCIPGGRLGRATGASTDSAANGGQADRAAVWLGVLALASLTWPAAVGWRPAACR